ncbi:MAG: acyl-CoA dehydrogenase, partial [Alphaproteobacteria bacterium]|nr:acyl-CoA dehydrogenase [Alphaproteobacteria bacterium]
MDFEHSERTKGLMEKLQKFMDDHIYPNEQTFADQMEAFGVNRWQTPQIIEDLKVKAKAQGLWNLF